MSTTTLETFEHTTGTDPVASIVWLHGLGADAHDFEPVVPALDLGPDRPLRFVFPNAPLLPVTINNGMVMRAWYDILSFGPGREDEAGIRAAAEAIGELIRREQARGVPPERIVLAGFSQGGATALFTALRFPERLAALLALSCYLPLPDRLPAELQPANQRLPIFMAHGEADHVLPLWIGEASRDALIAAGCDVRWKTYPMMHAVTPEELADIRDFLARQLPAPA
ncbi:MAG: carboxylesterase [Gammaproteobacteria bacterium]|nr:MAG: carboxylesterase [Gammaproteobacteria bacterium]